MNTRPPADLAAGALPVVLPAFAAAGIGLSMSVRSGPKAMTTRVMKRPPPCDGFLLYPLSYGSRMENPAGFEPATWRVIACSSIGIRHGPRAAFPLFPVNRRPIWTSIEFGRTHWSHEHIRSEGGALIGHRSSLPKSSNVLVGSITKPRDMVGLKLDAVSHAWLSSQPLQPGAYPHQSTEFQGSPCRRSCRVATALRCQISAGEGAFRDYYGFSDCTLRRPRRALMRNAASSSMAINSSRRG